VSAAVSVTLPKADQPAKERVDVLLIFEVIGGAGLAPKADPNADHPALACVNERGLVRVVVSYVNDSVAAEQTARTLERVSLVDGAAR
jgi:hypothetical protein